MGSTKKKKKGYRYFRVTIFSNAFAGGFLIYNASVSKKKYEPEEHKQDDLMTMMTCKVGVCLFVVFNVILIIKMYR